MKEQVWNGNGPDLGGAALCIIFMLAFLGSYTHGIVSLWTAVLGSIGTVIVISFLIGKIKEDNGDL